LHLSPNQITSNLTNTINQNPNVNVHVNPNTGNINAQASLQLDPKVALGVAKKAHQIATQEKARALYDFAGQQPGDLVFKAGDVIEIVSRDEELWWKGSLNGATGMVPTTYVELIPNEVQAAVANPENRRVAKNAMSLGVSAGKQFLASGKQ